MWKVLQKIKIGLKKVLNVLKPYCKYIFIVSATLILLFGFTTCLAREPTSANAQTIIVPDDGICYSIPPMVINGFSDYDESDSGTITYTGGSRFVIPSFLIAFDSELTNVNSTGSPLYCVTTTGDNTYDNKRWAQRNFSYETSTNRWFYKTTPVYVRYIAGTQGSPTYQWASKQATFYFEYYDNVPNNAVPINGYFDQSPDNEYSSNNNYCYVFQYYDNNSGTYLPYGKFYCRDLQLLGFNSGTVWLSVPRQTFIITDYRFGSITYDYEQGYNEGFIDGQISANTAGSKFTPWQSLVNAVDGFLEVPIFGDITIGKIFGIGFGIILFGLFIKVFAGG